MVVGKKAVHVIEKHLLLDAGNYPPYRTFCVFIVVFSVVIEYPEYVLGPLNLENARNLSNLSKRHRWLSMHNTTVCFNSFSLTSTVQLGSQDARNYVFKARKYRLNEWIVFQTCCALSRILAIQETILLSSPHFTDVYIAKASNTNNDKQRRKRFNLQLSTYVASPFIESSTVNSFKRRPVHRLGFSSLTSVDSIANFMYLGEFSGAAVPFHDMHELEETPREWLSQRQDTLGLIRKILVVGHLSLSLALSLYLSLGLLVTMKMK